MSETTNSSCCFKKLNCLTNLFAAKNQQTDQTVTRTEAQQKEIAIVAAPDSVSLDIDIYKNESIVSKPTKTEDTDNQRDKNGKKAIK